jgi:hypothetical protein
MDGDTCCYGGCLDWRWRDLPAAAAWTVRLRDYCGDFDVRLREKMDEGWDGEVRGAAEEDAHGVRPKLSTAILRQLRSFASARLRRQAQDDNCLEPMHMVTTRLAFLAF